MSLPPFLLTLLDGRPPAGAGVHDWSFRCARYLHYYFGDDHEGMFNLLDSYAYGCGRDAAQDIRDSIRNSKPCAWTPGQRAGGYKATPKWPKRNAAAVASLCTPDVPSSLEELESHSLSHIVGEPTDSETVIDQLFPNDALLCCGWSKWKFDTRTREEWRGESSEMQFIVPSPMSARKGRKKNPEPGESEMSAHTLDNTGPRTRMVVEFDKDECGIDIPIAEQIPVLWHLDEYLPLDMVVHSGGKSCQGWFSCGKETEAALEQFMRYAVSLGADPRGWVPSQFFRMPGGIRDNGKRQIVHYFSPETLK